MDHHPPSRFARNGGLEAAGNAHVCSEEFVRLFVKHERDVQAYILSLVPNWADAEDIFQETSVRLFQQSDRWGPEQDFRGWACMIAYYQVLTHRKRVHREKLRFSEGFIELVAEQQSVESDRSDGRRQALLKCLAQLDAAARRLLDLAYRGDLTIPQVAEQTGRSTGATYKSLSRVRHALRECVERSMRNEGRQ